MYLYVHIYNLHRDCLFKSLFLLDYLVSLNGVWISKYQNGCVVSSSTSQLSRCKEHGFIHFIILLKFTYMCTLAHDVFHYCICMNISEMHNKHTQRLVEPLHYFPDPWEG